MSLRLCTAVAMSCSVVMVLAGCSNDQGASGTQSGKLVKLQGAGASFPAPLYTTWFKEFMLNTIPSKSIINRSAAGAA